MRIGRRAIKAMIFACASGFLTAQAHGQAAGADSKKLPPRAGAGADFRAGDGHGAVLEHFSTKWTPVRRQKML
ncbi:MAG TPA: hypothetical protein VHY32_03985 [Caulobacteraceae bacterium]|jgi:hypothetical protein|nr:hypothetical protein [Caulobacteraceae bacterium]